jgi:hypothetical protein
MEDRDIRAALDRHWAASDANDFEAEHQIYREDAVLEYPQSGERIRGRRKIQSSRAAQPNRKRFTVRRIIGAADLWVTASWSSSMGRWPARPSISAIRSSRGLRVHNGSRGYPETWPP